MTAMTTNSSIRVNAADGRDLKLKPLGGFDAEQKHGPMMGGILPQFGAERKNQSQGLGGWPGCRRFLHGRWCADGSRISQE